MKAQTGNNQVSNKRGFVKSHNNIQLQYPLDYNSSSITKAALAPPATTSMSCNGADLLKHLEQQAILEKLAAISAGSLNFKSPLPLTPPLTPDCTSQLMSALSCEPALTSSTSRMPMHNTHSEADDTNNVLLRELKKNAILNQLLSATAAPELTTSSLLPSSQSINNNDTSLVERLLRNYCFNQKVGADALLATLQNDYPLLPSFTSREAAALIAETTATRNRTTFPPRNLAVAPSSSSQMRWKLNEMENKQTQNDLLHFGHQQQTKQRDTHSHLMSAAFNDLMERQRMLETREHDVVNIHRN